MPTDCYQRQQERDAIREQRRYEIARDVLAFHPSVFASDPETRGYYIRIAVEVADALLAELERER